MQYTLRQLEVFCAIARTQSFTKASEILNLSQPAVSLQFKAFSEQFDFNLFTAQGRRFTLTDFGQLIYSEATHILNSVEKLSHLNAIAKGQLSGTLRVSVVSTGKYIMPYLLSGFLSQHPKVDLQMDVTNRQQVVQSLLDNTVDFSLMNLIPDRMTLEHHTLMDNTLELVCSAEYRQTFDSVQFSENRFVFREHGSATRSAMEQYLKKRKAVPTRQLELASNEAVKQSLLAGLGVSILPRIGMLDELQKGKLVTLKAPDLPITSKWHLVWRNSAALSPLALAFLEHLKTHQQDLIAKYFS